MKQSLPGIKAISFVPCHLLSPNIVEKYRAGIPVGVFSTSTPIEHYGNASCEAVSEHDNGSRLEKTTLKFTTADEVPEHQDLAFVVKDAQGKEYIIGQNESPYPMVEISTSVDKDENIKDVKVVFSARKSLIQCSL